MLSPVLAQGATVFTAFIFTPIALKNLGFAQFGVYVILTTLIGIGGLLTFGIGDSTERLIAKYREKKDPIKLQEVIQMSLTLSLICSVIIFIILFLGARWCMERVFSISENLPLAIQATQVASFAVFFAVPCTIFIACLKGYQRFELSSFSRAVATLLVALFNIALLLNGYGLLALAASLVIFRLLFLFLTFYYARKCVPEGRWLLPGFYPSAARETLEFGLSLWIGSIFFRMRTEGLPLIIGAVLSPVATGLYSVASRPLMALMALLQQGTLFLMPYLTRIHEGGDTENLRLKYQQTSKVSVILAAAICSVFVFLAPTFYPLWLQEKSSMEIISIACILSISSVMIPMGAVVSQFIKAAGKGKIIITIQSLSSVVILLGTWIGARYWGVTGVAWAQCLTFLLILINRYLIEKSLFGSANLLLVGRLLVGAALPVLLVKLFFSKGAGFSLPVEILIACVVGLGAFILAGLIVGLGGLFSKKVIKRPLI